MIVSMTHFKTRYLNVCQVLFANYCKKKKHENHSFQSSNCKDICFTVYLGYMLALCFHHVVKVWLIVWWVSYKMFTKIYLIRLHLKVCDKYQLDNDKEIFCSLILAVYMAHLQACNHLDLINLIFMAQDSLVQVETLK